VNVEPLGDVGEFEQAPTEAITKASTNRFMRQHLSQFPTLSFSQQIVNQPFDDVDRGGTEIVQPFDLP